MAGDWIPVETCLPKKREVIAMAQILGMSTYEVVGRLVEFWGWVQNETDTGQIVDVRVDALVDARVVGNEFAVALQRVGWLHDDVHGVVVPNAERWLTKGAKARLSKNLRQQRWRNVGASVDASVDAGASTPPSTTEEKRRVYKKEPLVSSPKRKSTRRAPSDFTLTEERLTFATAAGLADEAAKVEFDKLRDYEFARGRSDWDAVWRNWVRTAVAHASNGNGAGKSTDDWFAPAAVAARDAAAAKRKAVVAAAMAKEGKAA
jgi:hypothetical protein